LFFVALLLMSAQAAFAQYSRQVGAGYGGYGGGYGGYGGYGGGYGGGMPFGNTFSTNPNFGRPNNLSLVIAQTQEGHQGVADLLEQLRRLQDQQVATQVRFNTTNDSFFERIGVGFGFNIKGGNGIVGLGPDGQPTPTGDIQFRQGGAQSAVPPFGGYDPASDGTLGFAVDGSEGSMLFNFFGGQGSTRTSVTQAPVVVIPNGGQGTISDTSQTPFVTGVIPVVGAPNMRALTGYGLPPVDNRGALQARLEQAKFEELHRLSASQPTRTAQPHAAREEAPAIHSGGGGSAGGPSSADRGDLSVADIRRSQAAGDTSEDRELAALIERGRGAEAAGKRNVAKLYYQQAARRASGEQKQELLQKVRELGQ
jgi:hypothetical protein